MIWRYLARRLFLLVFVLFALTVFVFSLNFMFPTDAMIAAGVLPQNGGSHTNILGQYINYSRQLMSGQWGVSLSTGQNVLTELTALLPATIELASAALVVSLLAGIPLGLLAAVRKDRWLDRFISGLALVGFSMPVFWWALLLIMVFSLQLGWLPTSGRISVLYQIPSASGFMLADILWSDLPDKRAALQNALLHLLMPTLVLACYPTTVMIRFVRGSMLNVLEQNYIKTARAKGLSRAQVLWHHGMRNALLPVTRQVGLQFSTLLTLAMLTEVIFSWPGIGQWLIDSIYQRNYPAIQAGVLVLSTLVILVNILTEILHTVFDPLARKL